VFENSDFVLILATLPSRENGLIQELDKSDAAVVYLNPIEDNLMVDYTTIESRYECGSEEGVLAILAKGLLFEKEIPLHVKSFFENLDEGYISAECNVGEEEVEEIVNIRKLSKKPFIFVGDDIKNHPREENIKKIVSMLVELDGFESNLKPVDFSDLEDVEELDSFDGTIIYKCNALDKSEEDKLLGSQQFAIAAKIKDGDSIKIKAKNEYSRLFSVEKSLKGTIALLPGARSDESYSYELARIVKEDV